MKRSHKNIIELLNSGCWLKANPWSYKTTQIMRGTRWLMDVRNSTIEEMRRPENEDLLHLEPYTEFDISTGGWSGNEDLIDALQGNWMFWSLCWLQSRRGGHYKFEVRKLSETSKV